MQIYVVTVNSIAFTLLEKKIFLTLWKTEQQNETWSAELSKSCLQLSTFMVWEYIFMYWPTNQALLQLFLHILASSRVKLCVHSYSQKFRSETLKIPICWLGCAGNNAETECLGYKELCQNGIIQWTENVLKHNQLQRQKPTHDGTISGTGTASFFFSPNSLGLIFSHQSVIFCLQFLQRSGSQNNISSRTSPTM